MRNEGEDLDKDRSLGVRMIGIKNCMISKLFLRGNASGYVNIGMGLPFISSLGAIIGLSLAFLATFFLILKRSFLLMWNRKIFRVLLIICCLLIIGIVAGTYSSLFLAGPILTRFSKNA